MRVFDLLILYYLSFCFLPFPPYFFLKPPESSCRAERQTPQKIMAVYWNVEIFNNHKIPNLVKNIYINTWDIVKLISGLGLWTRTVLLILVIVVLKEGDKTMSIMSEYFRNCSNNYIFSRPSKNAEKNMQVHTIDHYVPCCIWSMNSFFLKSFWEIQIRTWPPLARTEKLSEET